MDKSKKLRLKRKIPHKPKLITEVETNPKDVETITLSSDSDGEAGRPCKQRKVTHTENENVPTPTCPSKKGFLHTDNASLNRLREMILSLSPKDVDIPHLAPFPTFNTQVQGNDEIKDNVANLCKGRLQPVVELKSVEEELSPFPKLCKHFIKSSKMSKYTHSNEPSSCYVKDVLLNTAETGTSEKRGNSSSGFIVDCDNDKELKASTSQNVNEFQEDNSAIIRDRNANFYSLQSQNMHTNVGHKSGSSVSKSYQTNRTTSTQKMHKETKKKAEAVDKMEQTVTFSTQLGESSHPSKAGMSENVMNGSKICDTTRKGQSNIGLPHIPSNLSNDKHFEKRAGDLNIFPPKKHKTSTEIIHESESCSSGLNIKKSESLPMKHTNSAKFPRTSSGKDHMNVTGMNKESVTLQSCPLCQMKFDSRVSQMDLDSHIAACLSTSEDDVVW